MVLYKALLTFIDCDFIPEICDIAFSLADFPDLYRFMKVKRWMITSASRNDRHPCDMLGIVESEIYPRVVGAQGMDANARELQH